ncbi:CMGC/DYRK protein kinase [Paraphaeosphaeria sporulosa]
MSSSRNPWDDLRHSVEQNVRTMSFGSNERQQKYVRQHVFEVLRDLQRIEDRLAGEIPKFTDWGRAKVNELEPGGDSPKSPPRLTPPYRPPGVDEDRDEPASRPHDIWTLGFVFVDMLVWFNGVPHSH